eukprot:CAMPEP_0117687848 /NCGR_PEP_ID=MMETSP0804-20121206/23408_1 /TAXON_ID=1074897 /ORGANISM="Tetraselmis astigmatica, Strain CCMP880" /LENGTH=356 /DNA_ID=CAMNT_0005500047 /DNA_START=333 /DNA_END=1404 /DNA_ORIENTATION=+
MLKSPLAANRGSHAAWQALPPQLNNHQLGGGSLHDTGDLQAFPSVAWVGGTEWYNRQNYNPPVCTSPFYSDFADMGATMAVFETKVDSFSVLKIPPGRAEIDRLISGQQAVRNGTAPYCCIESSVVYNSLGNTAPFHNLRLDPFHHQDAADNEAVSFVLPNGVTVMHPLLVVTEYTSDTLVSSIQQQVSLINPVPLDVDTSQSVTCTVCNRWNPKEFLGKATSATINTTALQFSCFLNLTCAWGSLFCDTCLNGTYSNKTMPSWFTDNFVMTYSENGTEFTAEEKAFAEIRACDTFCAPFHQVWFMGADASGDIMTSSEDMSNTLLLRPFYALRAFHFLFGLSTQFLDSLSAVGLV